MCAMLGTSVDIRDDLTAHEMTQDVHLIKWNRGSTLPEGYLEAVGKDSF